MATDTLTTTTTTTNCRYVINPMGVAVERVHQLLGELRDSGGKLIPAGDWDEDEEPEAGSSSDDDDDELVPRKGEALVGAYSDDDIPAVEVSESEAVSLPSQVKRHRQRVMVAESDARPPPAGPLGALLAPRPAPPLRPPPPPPQQQDEPRSRTQHHEHHHRHHHHRRTRAAAGLEAVQQDLDEEPPRPHPSLHRHPDAEREYQDLCRITDLTRSNLANLQREVERYQELNKRLCLEAPQHHQHQQQPPTSWTSGTMAPTRLYLPASYPALLPPFPSAAVGGVQVAPLQPPAWMGRGAPEQHPWQHGGYL